jgi:hypothetical protein
VYYCHGPSLPACAWCWSHTAAERCGINERALHQRDEAVLRQVMRQLGLALVGRCRTWSQHCVQRGICMCLAHRAALGDVKHAEHCAALCVQGRAVVMSAWLAVAAASHATCMTQRVTRHDTKHAGRGLAGVYHHTHLLPSHPHPAVGACQQL